MPVWSTLWCQGVRFASWSTGDGWRLSIYYSLLLLGWQPTLPHVPYCRIAVVDFVGLPDVSAFRLSFSPPVGLLELL